MLFLRISLALIKLVSRIYEDFNQWRYIRHGRNQARKQAKALQDERIRRARAARLNSRKHDNDSMRKNDPYRRD